ncbi:MAG TPA: hypothetical protein VN624_10205 [Rhodanobacter sp.]|nr:hypothetical protein [Rhodanobacter sp.]
MPVVLTCASTCVNDARRTDVAPIAVALVCALPCTLASDTGSVPLAARLRAEVATLPLARASDARRAGALREDEPPNVLIRLQP